MNMDYIKTIFEENKDIFKESGLDVESPEDLKEVMISYMTSNMQYDFGIDLDKNKLFNSEEKHNNELLGNCISYLWEIWNNEDVETIEKNFRNLGFTDQDLLDFDISYDLEIIKRESESE